MIPTRDPRWKTATEFSSFEYTLEDWFTNVLKKASALIQRELPEASDFSYETSGELQSMMIIRYESTRGTDAAYIELKGNKMAFWVECLEPTGTNVRPIKGEHFAVGLSQDPNWLAKAIAVQVVSTHKKAWGTP